MQRERRRRQEKPDPTIVGRRKLKGSDLVERDWSDGGLDVVVGCHQCGGDILLNRDGRRTDRVCRSCSVAKSSGLVREERRENP